MKACWIFLAIIVGCVASEPVEGDPVDENVKEEIDLVDLTMPEYPAPRAGRLVAQSVAQAPDNQIDGNWPAESGRCQEPTVIQILAGSDSVGVIVFVGPSPDGTIVGEYEVYEGRYNVPDTLAARVGLQLYGQRARARGLSGVGGMVEIQRADSVLAGRFAVRLLDDRFQDTVLMAATFEGPLRNAPESWCSVFEPRPGMGSQRTRTSR